MKHLLILLLILTSCGTRKNETKNTEAIAIENNYESGTKIILGSSFTYTPFDGLKPMIIDGKKFENAIITGSESKTIHKYFKIKEVITIHTSNAITTTRTNHDFLWLGMFLIVVVAVWFWFKTGR